MSAARARATAVTRVASRATNTARSWWLTATMLLAAIAMTLMLVQQPASAQQGSSVRPPDSAVQSATPPSPPQGLPSSVRPPSGAAANSIPPPANPTEGKGAIYDTDMWRNVRKGIVGNVSIPDRMAGQLVQSDGEIWRNLRNGPLQTYGAWAMGGMIALLAAFFLIRGRIKIEHGWSGRTIVRFNELERFGHWLLAGSFILLALTGLNILYGRYVILPLIGKESFAALTIAGKWVHNYVAFAFMIGLALTFVLWLRHNFPTWTDLKWLAMGGGMFGRGVHPPAWKFNAGQKVLFWLVMLGGLSISLSGIALMFPFQTAMFAKTFGILNVFGLGLPTALSPLQEMQYATTWHSIVALFLTTVIIAHIYIGTIGMQGAFDALASGEVDVNWAKEHHSLWAEQELGNANLPPAGQPAPAE